MDHGTAAAAARRGMTAVVLAPGEHDDASAVPLTLRSEDRVRDLTVPIHRLSAGMIAILIGSVAVHGALVIAALVTDRATPPVPVKEIAVEIVEELPKVAPSQEAPQKTALAKTEPPKAAPPKPLSVEAKVAPSPPSPPQPQSSKPSPPPPAAQHRDVQDRGAQDRGAQDQAAAERAALEKQLAELRAQQAQLKTESLAPQPPPAPHGPLDGSQQALALPAVGADGDVVGYESLVFSQLAKAKEVGEYHGEAGTTGVHFEIDADGRLLGEAIAVSSGKAELDAEALAIVRRAAPFPPPPKDAERTFDANVNFIPSQP